MVFSKSVATQFRHLFRTTIAAMRRFAPSLLFATVPSCPPIRDKKELSGGLPFAVFNHHKTILEERNRPKIEIPVSHPPRSVSEVRPDVTRCWYTPCLTLSVHEGQRHEHAPQHPQDVRAQEEDQVVMQTQITQLCLRRSTAGRRSPTVGVA